MLVNILGTSQANGKCESIQYKNILDDTQSRKHVILQKKYESVLEHECVCDGKSDWVY